MTLALLLAHATKVALLAVLAGIIARGKARQCWSFVAYLAAILLGNTLASLWPEQFFTPSFWIFKQRVYDVLKMAIALELSWRVFAAFPGAWRMARLVLTSVLTASTAAVVAFRPHATYDNVYELQPSVTTAAIWLLTGTALIVVWYQIPIHDWQRAVMLGFAPYLLVFVILLRLMKRHGWAFLPQYGLLDTTAYLALLFFWVYAAWREARVDEPAAGTGFPVMEAVDAHA
jgi:hypothetical protein